MALRLKTDERPAAGINALDVFIGWLAELFNENVGKAQ